MSAKQFALIALAAGSLAGAGLTALSPHSPTDPAKQQQEQVREYSKNQEQIQRELKAHARTLQDANILDELRPVEPRPVDPVIRLRLRLP